MSIKSLQLDFTVRKYRELCLAITSSNYTPLTFREYLLPAHAGQKIVILRHDVDRKPLNALAIAKLENELGIKATYYFRAYDDMFVPSIIEKIKSFGHEIGYHYEVLSKANGDHVKAIKMFDSDLKKFRQDFEVNTISMHGSPLSKYNNLDIWNLYDYRNYGIIGEAYLSAGPGISYISDTGRSWSQKWKYRDIVPNNGPDMGVRTTDDLIRLIDQDTVPGLYLLTHPERWSFTIPGWTTNYLNDLMMNIGKKMIMRLRKNRGYRLPDINSNKTAKQDEIR